MIYLITVLTHRVFGVPLKIMADIFRYLGEPAYKRSVIDSVCVGVQALIDQAPHYGQALLELGLVDDLAYED